MQTGWVELIARDEMGIQIYRCMHLKCHLGGILVMVNWLKILLVGTTPDFLCTNGGIFTVGAAGVGGAPTVGVLGPQQLSRPYRWHCRGGW